MLIGCIADDFTGASDIANTLACGGLATTLCIGPEGLDAPAADAVVIAMKTRSIPAEEAVAQSLTALQSLQAGGCGQVVFKYCSTFDSTPAGNIGPVAMALARALGVKGVVVCPAFPGAGRTLYAGHLFVGDRLLSESGMEHHPLNPMTDPDIRRWLGRQTGEAVGHVPHAQVRTGREAIRAALDRAADMGQTLVIVDAVSAEDLRAIGAACADDRLITGGSGIALGLPDNLRRRRRTRLAPSRFARQPGPALVLSGSCSEMTRRQVAAYRRYNPAFELDLEGAMGGVDIAAAARAFLRAHSQAAPLVFSSAEPARVAQLQAKHGRERLSGVVEALFARIAQEAVEDGRRRFVVAGGETSGAVVSGLGILGLDLGPEIDPGVPMLSTGDRAGPNLALALKSGNFGHEDFFARAIGGLGGEP